MKNEKTHPVRVMVAHDHPLVCDGARFVLAAMSEVEVVAVVDTPSAMIRLVGEHEPHILLVEPFMREQAMLKTLSWVHGEWPQMAIIALSVYEDAEHMRQAFQVGACSYLTIRTARETVRQAMMAALRGEALLPIESLTMLSACAQQQETLSAQPREEQPLTARELKILQRVALGERNKEIAAFFNISEPTVKTHLANIYEKLGVDSRASAVAVALKNGILLFPHIGADV